MKSTLVPTEKDLAEMKRRFTYDGVNLLYAVEVGVARCKRYPGDIAGSLKRGHLMVVFNRKGWMVHRIIYYLHHNVYPPLGIEIDHRDGNPLNNRLENLRLATRSQNMMNISVVRNKTGIRYVYYRKVHGDFVTLVNGPFSSKDKWDVARHAELGAMRKYKEFYKEPPYWDMLFQTSVEDMKKNLIGVDTSPSTS